MKDVLDVRLHYHYSKATATVIQVIVHLERPYHQATLLLDQSQDHLVVVEVESEPVEVDNPC